MRRRDIGTDDPRVRVRPPRSSRPRTKRQPDYSDRPLATVIGVDRGRYHLIDDEGTRLTAIKARHLGRGGIVVGDRVRLTGDLTGKPDTLARIVTVEDRRTQLRRSGEDQQSLGTQKVMVANAHYLVIVTAMDDPPPRPGFIDRCLVAAFDAGMEPVLVLTKSDLGDPHDVRALASSLGVRTIETSIVTDPESSEGFTELADLLAGEVSVLVGHSGVGKSTLINAMIPLAGRRTGHVNDTTGRGRHTSTNVVALELPAGGWVIDTPGVRGFGLAHVDADRVLSAFPDLEEASEECPRGCEHVTTAECGLAQWVKAAQGEERELRAERVASVRRLLTSVRAAQERPWETGIG